MRSYTMVRVLLVLAGSSLLLGCGGGAMGTQPPASAQQMPNNANGATVLDASGGRFYFSAKGGLYQVGTNTSLSNFGLSPQEIQAGQYPLQGSEGYCSPGVCAALVSLFDVVLTKNPAGAGCVAVLAINGIQGSLPRLSVYPTFFMGLTISTAPYGFSAPSKTVTAYKTYWNGNIPICGGNSPYAGAYTSTDTSSAAFASGWTLSGGKCVAQTQITSRDTGAPYVNFTIDSGGVVDSESSQITGSMNTPVNTSSIIGAVVASQTDASCTPVVNVTSMTQNSAGKWVLVGTESFAGQTTPFDATQN